MLAVQTTPRCAEELRRGGAALAGQLQALSLTLTAEQIDAGLATDRAWALDLISDTPYLLMVWGATAAWLQYRTGHRWLLPWRMPRGDIAHQPDPSGPG